MADQNSETTVELFTDGACSGNPGPGGWGVLLRTAGDKTLELSGSEMMTTNNRMELMAAIRGLEALKRPVKVDIYTDSLYVRDGMTQWLEKWKQNGWKTAGKQEVKNIDLWQQLEALCAKHHVTWHWVRGHAGHKENERADFLARHAIVQAMMQETMAAATPETKPA
ncbi:MAG: ribonuclease HI [Holosporales bacterium]